MACNCNKGKAATQVVYTDPKGKKTTYRTQIEAQAAKIRNGGGSFVEISR